MTAVRLQIHFSMLLNWLRGGCFVISLLLAGLLQATEQEPDVILYEGKKAELETHWMFASPLQSYFEERSLKYPYEEESTANYRGHVATWEILDNKLYLVRIEVRPPRKDEHSAVEVEKAAKAEVRKQFSKSVDARGAVLADWYTGNIRVFADPIKKTYKSSEDNESYEMPGFSTVVLLQVKNGEIVRKTSFLLDEYWKKFETARAYRAVPEGEREAINEHLAYLDTESKGWEDRASIEPTGPQKQESDFSLFLTRYITTPIKIPLTKCVIVKDVKLSPKGSGWILDSELRMSPGGGVLMIEMGSTNVPAGPWSPYTGGAVQVLIPLSNIGSQRVDIDNENPTGIRVINNFLTGNQDTQKIQGNLDINKSKERNGPVVVNGVVKLTASAPTSYQEVVFESAKIPEYDLKTYLETFHKPGEIGFNDAGSILKRIQKDTGKEAQPAP